MFSFLLQKKKKKKQSIATGPPNPTPNPNLFPPTLIINAHTPCTFWPTGPPLTMSALPRSLFLLLASLISCSTTAVSLRHGLSPPTTVRLTDLFPHLPFDKAFSDFYGGPHIKRVSNGSGVTIALDKATGEYLQLVYCRSFVYEMDNLLLFVD